MLDLRYIREHQDEIRSSIKRRGVVVDFDRWLKLDVRRSELIPQVDELRGALKTTGKPSPEELADLQNAKKQLSTHEDELKYVEAEWNAIWGDIPNLIAEDTPDGGEAANREEKQYGAKPSGLDAYKDHLELNEKLGFVDFESGAKVAGSRFYFLKAKGFNLWRACLGLISDIVTQEGFEMIMVPHMVNSRVAEGTGFLPRGEERQIYKIDGEDLNLIATAELPLTGMFMDDVIDVMQPHLFAGLSTCYRMEAGTYGKFAKGLYRVHQFEKLELYAYTTPEASSDMLQKILALEEKICQALEIPYRIIRIAAGDLSAPAYQKYDVEYWSPADDSWRELTSCSNCADYQARRLNIRYRDESGQLQHVHTLNGTAITSTRTLIALLENHQTAEGSVQIPQALQSYYGGTTL
ncbi:MAG: serine--tRNA ligase [bacterium]